MNTTQKEKAPVKKRPRTQEGVQPRMATKPKAPAVFFSDEPKMPGHLNEQAKLEWRYIIDSLKASGQMHHLDRAILATYCMTYARLAEAELEIEEFGQAYLESAENPVLKNNPWVGIRDKLANQLIGLAGELGFTPASRAKISPKTQQQTKVEVPSAASSYFN